MTNENYNKQITAFTTDLDENISQTTVWDGLDRDFPNIKCGEVTTFYFHNPVTGQCDAVSFFEDYDTHPIIYIADTSAIKFQVNVADLKDLYIFILIEEK
jgi:hypothetical protein